MPARRPQVRHSTVAITSSMTSCDVASRAMLVQQRRPVHEPGQGEGEGRVLDGEVPVGGAAVEVLGVAAGVAPEHRVLVGHAGAEQHDDGRDPCRHEHRHQRPRRPGRPPRACSARRRRRCRDRPPPGGGRRGRRPSAPRLDAVRSGPGPPPGARRGARRSRWGLRRGGPGERRRCHGPGGSTTCAAGRGSGPHPHDHGDPVAAAEREHARAVVAVDRQRRVGCGERDRVAGPQAEEPVPEWPPSPGRRRSGSSASRAHRSARSRSGSAGPVEQRGEVVGVGSGGGCRGRPVRGSRPRRPGRGRGCRPAVQARATSASDVARPSASRAATQRLDLADGGRVGRARRGRSRSTASS